MKLKVNQYQIEKMKIFICSKIINLKIKEMKIFKKRYKFKKKDRIFKKN
jgi:hypothetical protein